MAMDAAAVKALVTAAVAEALAAVGASAGSGGGGAGRDIHKSYSRVEKFDGENWKEWHHQFSVATNAYNAKHGALIDVVEKKDLDEVTTSSLELELTQGESNWMQGTQAELFSVLALLTKGEANQIVRSCEDMNGYTAWKKLYDRYNPKTPASLTAAWREVIRPKKLRDIREASKAIDAWESKVVVLKKEHGEEPTTGLKASLLLEMLPDSLQMTVAQGLSSKKLDYDSLKSKIRLMASVQTDYSTPKPMDIGEMNDWHNRDWEEENWDYGVDAVGAQKGKGRGPMFGSCWTCGGAHFSRDCPKGGAKGLKGKGKSDATGKGKGKGQLPAPMYGSCWNCGGAHFSRDCPKSEAGTAGGKAGGKSKGKGKTLREVEEGDAGEQEEVSSVSECWHIFGVEVRGRRGKGLTRRWGRNAPKPVATSNRFEVLAEVDEKGHASTMEDIGLDCATDGYCVDDGICCACVTDEIGLNCTVGGYGVGDGNCRDDFDCDIGSKGVADLADDAEEEWIQWVADGESHQSVKKGEIVVDSGAAESVCPWDWAAQFPTRGVPPDRKRNFLNASGGRMEHYGEKRVRCGVDGMEAPISMLFQVSDARNPLASVARITEHGNLVQFGPRPEDNYIYNPATEEKVMLRKKGRKFVLDVNFLGANSHFSGQA